MIAPITDSIFLAPPRFPVATETEGDPGDEDLIEIVEPGDVGGPELRSPSPSKEVETSWGERDASGVPRGFRKGFASGAGNNCLIDSLAQLVCPTWSAGRRRCEAARIRRLLHQAAGVRFLSLEQHWRPVLEGLGKSPQDYHVTAVAEHGVETYGRGPTALHLYCENYDHFVPLHAEGES